MKYSILLGKWGNSVELCNQIIKCLESSVQNFLLHEIVIKMYLNDSVVEILLIITNELLEQT
jgi:hypothetical protein